MRGTRVEICSFVALLGVLLGGCGSDSSGWLLQIDGLAEVVDTLSHGSTYDAQVLLDNGGYIHFRRLERSAFAGTDEIYVSQIGNIHISCSYPEQRGIISGHNILAIFSQLAPSQSDRAPITTVEQLVQNYHYVIGVINFLPIKGERGREISFPNSDPTAWSCVKILLV